MSALNSSQESQAKGALSSNASSNNVPSDSELSSSELSNGMTISGLHTNGEDAANLDQDIYCACKYSPYELFTAFGLARQPLEGEEASFETAESRLHANVCCHAKATLQQALPKSRLFFTDCCDSMRRVYDALSTSASQASNPHEFLYMMELPHDDGTCAQQRFAQELKRLAAALESATGTPFQASEFIKAFEANKDKQAIPAQGPFVAIMGARTTPQLVTAIKNSLPVPVIDLTCAEFRDIEDPPSDAQEKGFDELMAWYAGALLRMTPCMRMTNIARRRQLLEHPNLKGIVYNTVKFCDYYGFDHADLMDHASIPILKLETDHQIMPAGQLSTRLEAFAETLGLQRTQEETEASMQGTYYAGIDSGSTTTNMVVLDEDRSIVATSIVRTGPKASQGANVAFQDVCAQLGATPESFRKIVATGYGRSNIPFATDSVTEITCHACGVHHVLPHVRGIIDIGGQDSKVICLDEQGEVTNFVMNDKCAAGTGRFLEAMARTLELDLPDMVAEGLAYKKDITISSMCTVFAESEVISLIADDVAASDIIHGLNKAIASRTAAMAKRSKANAPFAMTGGVANNPGVVQELSRALGETITVPDTPDLCGALGAALIAMR